MRDDLSGFAPNPSYGDSLCRRLVRLSVMANAVDAHLSDNFHEMRCRITHDGDKVTAVSAEAIRIPTSMCALATSVLQDLVGTALDTSIDDHYADGRALDHCTHLFDLAILAIRHARIPGTTIYDARVPDELDAPVALSVTRNGEMIHDWLVRQGIIQEPAALQGRPLGRGFMRWARDELPADTLDAAIVLTRTWLIANGRRFAIADAVGQTIARNTEMLGRCFAYRHDRAAKAVFIPGHLRAPNAL